MSLPRVMHVHMTGLGLPQRNLLGHIAPSWRHSLQSARVDVKLESNSLFSREPCSKLRHFRLLVAAIARPSDGDTPTVEAGEWIQVGVVGPPHGVRGEFKVQPLTDFPEDRLGKPGTRWLQPPNPKIKNSNVAESEQLKAPYEVQIEWGRSSISKGREVWLVKLQGVETPEEAAGLRGHFILIAATERPPLEDEDEFYVQDLMGLRVEMAKDGKHIGTVVDIFDGTGTHDVIRIELQASTASEPPSEDSHPEEQPTRYMLLPFAKEIVPEVDLQGKVMRVVPPEGLFEIATTSNSRQKLKRREHAGKRERRNPRIKPQNDKAEGVV